MAKIRSIKPETWEDEKFGKLKRDCRLLYIGMWNFCDDQGVIKSNVTYLKSRIFPYDEELRAVDIKSWLDALADARMLIPFSYNNEGYYVIRTFRSHQIIDKRYAKYSVPEKFCNSILSSHNVTTWGTHGEHMVDTSQERRGEEGKGGGEEGIFPAPDFEIELDDMKIGQAVEYLSITKHITATREIVLTLWTVFKTKNFTGAKFYRTRSDIISHFFESLKYAKIEQNGAHKQPTSRSSKSAGADILLNQLKQNLNSG